MVRYFVLGFIMLPLITAAQAWDFSVPEKLPGSVNSEYEESMPLLSPDGKTLYFTRFLSPENVGGKYTGSDVWQSQYDLKTFNWGKAKNSKDALNNRGNNAIVGISNNGQTIYFLNTQSSKPVNGIYFSKKIGNSWTRPELIPISGIAPEGFLGLYVSPDFDVIFLSMKGPDSRGDEDLYVSVKTGSGKWSVPKNLGPSVNTNGFEISPFLSADKKRLYFASNGHRGQGDADIFYSDRLYNSWETWSAPRNLGDKLNSKGFDAFFSLYGDTIAYFTSNRGERFADIYRVKVVPGDEALAFGQRYLSSEEMGKLIGANVSRRIVFENSQADLSGAQRELLFYIANKLSDDKELGIQLSVTEENNPALTEGRLTAIQEQLKLAGIDGTRIYPRNSRNIKRENKRATIIEIVLFK